MDSPNDRPPPTANGSSIPPTANYNTSPEGKGGVHYASATETYSFEQFESLFRRPDIIRARLAGDLKAGYAGPGPRP